MKRIAGIRRRKWTITLAATFIVAIVFTAGTLSAANWRQHQPQHEAPPEQPGIHHPLAAPYVQDEPAPEQVAFQNLDEEQIETDLPPIVKKPPAHPNLDANLNQVVEQDEATEPRPQPASEASTGPATSDEAPILVTIYVDAEQADAVQDFLTDHEIYIRNVGTDYIEAHVPPGMLVVVSELPGVKRVNSVIPPRSLQRETSSVSQGVGIHGADAWHSAGYRGQSVKVGVIDKGFQNFRQLQGSDLPRNVAARCYFETARAPSARIADCEVDTPHGTAAADTVLDVAPSAQLYIANPVTHGDLTNAVSWMANQGVQVINYSLSDIAMGPGDGTTPFSNSPFHAIDLATANDIVWITAGGNDARRTWYGQFADPDRDGIHNFDPNNEANIFELNPGERIFVFMRWEDSWRNADCDLDLAVFKWLDREDRWQLVAADTEVQNGSRGDYPLAWVEIEATTVAQAGHYGAAIYQEACATKPRWIQLTAWIDDDLRYYSDRYHIGNPAESRNPAAMAVAATHYWDTDSTAYYSSRGPTLDGRIKPDITGIACGRSAVYTPPSGSRCWFGGTSQAAPHVAGLAALIRQRFPQLTPRQTVDYLKNHATERGPTGADTTWGHGFATLPTPSEQPTPTQQPEHTPTIPPTAQPKPNLGDLTPTANIAVRGGGRRGEAIISWDHVPGATYYRIGYVNMETDYPLAVASLTGEWLEAFVYVDVNAANLPPSNGRVEYTVRRLESGVRHAITVLTSNDVVNTKERFGGQYLWPSNPRWRFHNAY